MLPNRAKLQRKTMPRIMEKKLGVTSTRPVPRLVRPLPVTLPNRAKVSGRTRARLCLFRGSAAADSLRQHEAGGGEDSGWRRAEEDAGILGTAEPLFV